MNADDLKKLQTYLRETFETDKLTVRPRPKKTDSAEVYKDDEYIAIIYVDDEDGEKDYIMNMSILQIDLPET
ncbi:MAG: DUF3126 family protein [Pseudomonadota bacterium]